MKRRKKSLQRKDVQRVNTVGKKARRRRKYTIKKYQSEKKKQKNPMERRRKIKIVKNLNALLKQMEARTFLMVHFLYKPESVSLFKFLQFVIAIKMLYECLIK